MMSVVHRALWVWMRKLHTSQFGEDNRIQGSHSITRRKESQKGNPERESPSAECLSLNYTCVGMAENICRAEMIWTETVSSAHQDHYLLTPRNDTYQRKWTESWVFPTSYFKCPGCEKSTHRHTNQPQDNGTHPPEGEKKTDRKPEMTQMLELTGKAFKGTILTILCEMKQNMFKEKWKWWKNPKIWYLK